MLQPPSDQQGEEDAAAEPAGNVEGQNDEAVQRDADSSPERAEPPQQNVTPATVPRGEEDTHQVSAPQSIAITAQETPGKQTGRKKTFRGYQTPTNPAHRTFVVKDGAVHYDRLTSFDAVGGILLNRIPHVELPLVGLMMSSSHFLTSSTGEQQLLFTFYGRIDLTPPVTIHRNGTDTKIQGVQASLGTCFVPYYNSESFIWRHCTGIGGGFLSLDYSHPWSIPGLPDRASPGFVVVSHRGSLEYNFVSWLHMGIGVGIGIYMGDVENIHLDGSRSKLVEDYQVAFQSDLNLGVTF